MSTNQETEEVVTDSGITARVGTSEEPGTGPMRRAISCRLQVAVVLEGRGDRNQIDTSAIENDVNQNSPINFNVRQRDARINGDAEVLLISRGSILGEDTLEEAVERTRRELINQNAGFEILEWRAEAV